MRSNLLRTGLVMCLGFIIAIVALGNIQIVQREKLINHPRNRYSFDLAREVLRGGIFDRQGETLAVSVKSSIAYVRQYSLGAQAAHLLGYSSETRGSTGAENWFQADLLGQTGTLRAWNLLNRLAGNSMAGYDLQLTIDARLQETGYQLLGGRKGAIVVLNPQTGEILALVSSPGFDPEKIDTNWEMYSASGDLPLFNRALQGAYPPGSIFKLLTYAAAVETDPTIIDRSFICPGSVEVEGRRLNCIATHGEISLKEALARSCNVVFAQVAMELGETRLRDQAETMGINKRIPADFPVKVSSFGPAGEMSANALVETGIGQGELAITPFQAALLVAAVANDGILMKPYLLKAKALPGKEFTDFSQPQAWRRVMGSRTAHYLKEAMVEAVQSGTARHSRIAGIEVAGKTGSAENPHGRAHAWFVGFAPGRHPRVAVAVILENAGSGGTYAAPVAREMIQLTLSLVGEEK